MPSAIAAQLYTLREFLKTPADIAKSLAKVRQAGYEAVQLSGLGPIDAKELAKILKNEGLTCCATHISLDRVKKEPQAIIDEHKLWHCPYTAIGGFFLKEATLDDWNSFIRDFNAASDLFTKAGLPLGYHNHSHELAKYDGVTALQRLIDGLKDTVWMEIDTYWITHGGGDPAAWIRKVKGRIPCVHFKDMAITPKREQIMAEVGEGNLNWPEILKACREAGVKWYIIEQDTCQRDPFESLAISLRNLKAMGLK